MSEWSSIDTSDYNNYPVILGERLGSSGMMYFPTK